ncbi:DUF6498-containing protein [Halobacteria archaeon AArc-m2/3/4]|uniref:DUF6498-containing protein n=1 Tax=Natronoglomus mannanivorans TaxID=2979990 RepID=A0ABT2QLB0_9EURY|nr:DUF6498-containing protein [Halobacteria archaeon AArc-m2/3/4]
MNGPHRHLLAIIGANLVPLVGFVLFGWSTTVFLGVLVLDIWSTVFWSVCKMPFAEKRPPNLGQIGGRILGVLADKRGGWTVTSRLPPVYPRNLPFLLSGTLIGAILVVLSFVLWVLPYQDLTGEQLGWILLGGLIVFTVRGIDTWREYVRAGGYRDHSARTVGLEQFQQFLAVGGLVVGVVAAAAITGNTDPPFVGDLTLVSIIFLGKFGADLRAWQIETDPDRRGWFTRIYGSPETEHPLESVTVPDEEPNLCVRPVRRVAIVDAVVRGGLYTFSAGGVIAMALLVAGLAGVPGLTAAGLVAGGTLIVLRTGVRYLQFGTLEYRCYDELVVVYDRVLDEPQRRLDRWAITHVRESQTILDRLCGTETVSVETTSDSPESTASVVPDPAAVPVPDPDADRPITLAFLSDSTPLLEAMNLERRLESTPEPERVV